MRRRGTSVSSGWCVTRTHACNRDDLNFTISMTRALGMGVFNGNRIEPRANLYAASRSANASMTLGSGWKPACLGYPANMIC